MTLFSMKLYCLGWYFIVWGETLLFTHIYLITLTSCYSTVTDLAKLRGWSTSVPLITAT